MVMHTHISKVSADHCGAASTLSLLHVFSTTLPVGAFAYSQGLEYALDENWCRDKDDIHAWINDNLSYGFGRLDLPIYIRIYEAWKTNDKEKLNKWNALLLAFRETHELYCEDVQVGKAFAQWHIGIDEKRKSFIDDCDTPTVVAMSALASKLNAIELKDALLGYTWSWCENQIACASKALPMGQTDGQQILHSMIPRIVEVCQSVSEIEDDDIGGGTMALAMASSWHEHQYSRLFRS